MKINDVRIDKQSQRRIDPGDIVAIAKHKYRVDYDPVELGAVGPPPADNLSQEIMRESLLSLTPAGRAIYEELAPHAREFAHRLIEAVPAADQAVFERALTRLIERSADLLAETRNDRDE